ncbi:MAG: hypothetical protein ACOY3K_07390 [Candidatus Omnitrophota bacterium]
MGKIAVAGWILSWMIGLSSGCAKQEDPRRPIEAIEAEIGLLSVPELQSKAQTYARLIRAQKKKLSTIQTRLGRIPAEDLAEEQARKIREEITQIAFEISELAHRYHLYAARYLEKGGEAAKIHIS